MISNQWPLRLWVFVLLMLVACSEEPTKGQPNDQTHETGDSHSRIDTGAQLRARKLGIPEPVPIERFPVKFNGVQGKVWAASSLRDHSAMLLMDGDTTTAWAEGIPGDGEGISVGIDFGDSVTIEGFILYPGYMKSEQTFTENSAPREMTMYADESLRSGYVIAYDLALHVPDGEGASTRNAGSRSMACYHTADDANFSPRVFLFSHPIQTQSIKLVLIEALTGSRYDDVCISEWEILRSARAVSDTTGHRSVVRVLSMLRDGLFDSLRHSTDGTVEDLRRKYVPRDPGRGYIYLDSAPADSLSYFRRVALKDRIEGDSPFAKFLAYTLPCFIDGPVVVHSAGGNVYVIGVLAASYGDSEWLEFYSTIVLNKDYEIIELKELAHADGAPGCHNVIPHIQ